MIRFNRHCLIVMSLCTLFFSSPAISQNSQVIQDIRIDGLQRVKDSTIFELLPLDIGDNFDQTTASKTIRDLYKTGSFKRVDIFFQDSIVFIKLEENASIASIDFKGNKVFNDEILRNCLLYTSPSPRDA